MTWSAERHSARVKFASIINVDTMRRPGACQHCGAFRTDGQPVEVHFFRCPGGPDGMQIGVLSRHGRTNYRGTRPPAGQGNGHR